MPRRTWTGDTWVDRWTGDTWTSYWTSRSILPLLPAMPSITIERSWIRFKGWRHVTNFTVWLRTLNAIIPSSTGSSGYQVIPGVTINQVVPQSPITVRLERLVPVSPVSIFKRHLTPRVLVAWCSCRVVGKPHTQDLFHVSVCECIISDATQCYCASRAPACKCLTATGASPPCIIVQMLLVWPPPWQLCYIATMAIMLLCVCRKILWWLGDNPTPTLGLW